VSDYNVFECSRQPTAVVRGSLSVDELPGFFGRAIEQVAMTLTARGTPPTRAPFAFYPTVPGATIDVEAGFRVAEPVQPAGDVVPSALPAGTVITTTHIGPYDRLEESYRSLNEWAAEHGFVPSGPMWEVYMNDPDAEPDPRDWRTDLFVYVVPAPVTAPAPA
jgi:effector-binding domain-containing protein